ncbi:biotin synthesis protein [Neoasaia chiangmaiensis NBRC 101099]|uniref:dethiobiotin synthase n=1 Tax=Neoasaia chiangmaiensis TaxID=320497 RepID=UPI001194B577|nr:dethiobiotin synthase [Neoasaia chiangmaiensis]GBR37362.1 biotin synthesis protein [Neoasaia chiangmaiensis NBRC 101099]GEN14916.1 dethiobiotin synthase [Neoasaia chiangmaiensis]
MNAAGLSDIAQRFDEASGYDTAARIQKRCAMELADRIRRIFCGKSPKRILEFGCGTGFLTAELVRLFPHAEIVATDIAPGMIRRAQSRLHVPNVRFEVMDAQRPKPDGRFDLICSSLCLQWFTDRALGLARLASQLSAAGRLMVTTLARGSFDEWRKACDTERVPCGFPTYPEPDALASDWPVNGHGKWDVVDLRDTPADGMTFLRELRDIGATTPALHSRSAGIALRRVIRRFDSTMSGVTYKIAFGDFERHIPKGVFVTGTDTGVGKTLTSACLVRAWHANYWKPLQTGLAEEDGDAPTVRSLARLSDNRMSPSAYALQAPLSPLAAAEMERITIDPARFSLPSCSDTTPLVVEGAGGLLVPVTDDWMLIDLIALYGMPVVLVARSGLGTINHTLLSIEALRARAIPIAGVVLNGAPNPGNRAMIERFGHVRILAEIPLLPSLTAEVIDERAQFMPPPDSIFGPDATLSTSNSEIA